MFNRKLPALPLTLLLAFFCVCLQISDSWGYNFCSYYYEALLDTDNNALTGGPVEVVQGNEAPHDILGIDYKVRVMLDFESNNVASLTIPLNSGPHLGPIEVWEWQDEASMSTKGPKASSSFVLIDTNFVSYPLGIENGVPSGGGHFADVIEFLALRSLLGNPQDPVKVVYHASTGAPNDYTAPFQGPLNGIPSLSQWGLLLLSLVLALSAIWIIRKKRAAVLGILLGTMIVFNITGLAWAPPPPPPPMIILDGEVGDWMGVPLSVADAPSDSSVDDPGEDILTGFMQGDENYFYFRMDISGGPLPGCGIDR